MRTGERGGETNCAVPVPIEFAPPPGVCACLPVCLLDWILFVFFWLAYLLRSSVRRKGCDVIRELPLAVSEIYVRSFGGTCYSSCKGVNIFI